MREGNHSTILLSNNSVSPFEAFLSHFFPYTYARHEVSRGLELVNCPSHGLDKPLGKTFFLGELAFFYGEYSWYISKWLLFPCPWLKCEGIFLGYFHCDNPVEYLEIKPTKCRNTLRTVHWKVSHFQVSPHLAFSYFPKLPL